MSTPAAPADKPAAPPRHRLALRYSLRTFLIAITLLCLASGLWLNRAVRQRIAVRHFLALAEGRPPDGGEILPAMLYAHNGQMHTRPILPAWQQPFARLLGEEAFGEVIGVQILNTPTTDDDLRYLADLPSVTQVWLSRTKVTDQGLGHLKACPKLTFLTLDETAVTDAGAAQLGQLTNLESLSLSGTQITDAGLPHLAKLTNLKHLWLRQTTITNTGYRQLQSALPNTEIQADLPAASEQHQYPFWGGNLDL